VCPATTNRFGFREQTVAVTRRTPSPDFCRTSAGTTNSTANLSNTAEKGNLGRFVEFYRTRNQEGEEPAVSGEPKIRGSGHHDSSVAYGAGTTNSTALTFSTAENAKTGGNLEFYRTSKQEGGEAAASFESAGKIAIGPLGRA
jgi:hypothetical protein